MSKEIFLVVGIVVICFLVGTGIRDKLRRLRAVTKKAFAEVEAKSALRHDLAQNLVAAAVERSRHSTAEVLKEVLRQAADALSAAGGDPADRRAMAALARLEEQLDSEIAMTFLVLQPATEPDSTLMRLDLDLALARGAVTKARQAFNATVLDYNFLAQQFPTNVVAAIFSVRTLTPLLGPNESPDARVDPLVWEDVIQSAK